MTPMATTSIPVPAHAYTAIAQRHKDGSMLEVGEVQMGAMGAEMSHNMRTPGIRQPRFFVSADVYSSRDSDGTVILNVNSGRLYSLISAGCVAWRKISDDSDGVTVESVVEELLAEGMFVDASRHDTRQAVESMLNKLVELGIAYRNDIERGPLFSVGVRSLIASAIARSSRLVATAFIEFKFYTIAAFLYLLMFEMVINLAGFRQIHHTAKKWPVTQNKSTDKALVAALSRATDRACAWYPRKAMCLPRAIVMTCLLRQSGIAAVTVIAVQKNPFVGHAWSEVNGKIANDETVERNDYGILERV